MPTISVLIPSRGDSAKLARCLGDLSRQTHEPVQVLVGLDSNDEAEAERARASYGPLFGGRLRLEAFGNVGYMPIRAALFERAIGEVFVSMNDDVRVDGGFVRAHASAHAESGTASVFSGPAPWAGVESPTVFDAAVRESDMIFFRQRPDASGGLGYRECYGLNMSAPVAEAERAGGFASHLHAYGYDDIDLAYR
ncbi:MAG: glycosyltransferase family A protein, partial [Planctomycetota bacterium]